MTRSDAPVGRRVVLGMLGMGGLGVLFGAKVQDVLERTLAPLAARDGTGLSSLLPVGRFRIYTVTGELPSRSRTAYRLAVDGFVREPYQITFDELVAMPPTRLTRDFQCVTGWRVHDVKWAGVRLSDLLDRAGVNDGAQGVRFISIDGAYSETLTLEQARRDDVIVAYELEGKAISDEHGGPARLYVAPMYGYKSCKWLERIEVTKGQPRPGYWEVRGYDIDAWVGRSNGRDDSAT
ncbi:MAG TPA: molybdopterin-dependent oxidoreductase [Acidimicrobiales bacterium]|nr:molybdopterin-dependent oxidoreductase [Acidimicrobiales bacterium]